jgi:hypothetical protein
MKNYGTFKDKAREWIRTNQTTLIYIGAAIAIAVIVNAIMTPSLAVTHGEHDAAMTRVDQGFSHMGAELADTARTLTSVSRDLEAAEDAVANLTETVGGYDEAIGAMGTRVGSTESSIERVEGNLAEVEEAVNKLNSPPEAWLTGVAGNYTLHAKSSKAGDFTANVVLCYSPPVAINATSHGEAMDAFYGGLTAGATLKPYVPTVSYNGTDWGVSSVSFNVGTFALDAGVVKPIAVVYGGLPTGYVPEWAYAEVYQALKAA